MFCLSLSVALISMAAGEHLAHCCSIKKSSHSHTTLLYFASCAKALFLSDRFFLHCFLIILLSDLISVKVQDARFLIEEEKKSSWQYLVLRDMTVSFPEVFSHSTTKNQGSFIQARLLIHYHVCIYWLYILHPEFFILSSSVDPMSSPTLLG